MNIGMVGYGMMGVWHTEALAGTGAVPYAVTGRRVAAARDFAARYGYARVHGSLAEMLADPAVDAVVLASPSEHHEAQAVACLEAEKPLLLEIPIALDLAGAERVVAAGEASGVVWGMCHPMRHRVEREPLVADVRAGRDRVRHVAGRFFLRRLVNQGVTGYRRSWTDNLLWHHFGHFVDLGLWLTGAPVRRVQSHYGPLDGRTGIPMDAVVLIETEAEQTVLVHGSYLAHFRLYDTLVLSERDSWFEDIPAATVRTAEGVRGIESEQANCARATRDFVDAVRAGRPPRTTGASVLPAMRVLQQVQDDWDRRFGAQPLPGRPLA